jgi:hypothetical protein
MVVSSFVGREQGVALVQKYDIWFLYHMLVKCHEHLHPIIDSQRNVVDQNNFDQDCSLDIFE